MTSKFYVDNRKSAISLDDESAGEIQATQVLFEHLQTQNIRRQRNMAIKKRTTNNKIGEAKPLPTTSVSFHNIAVTRSLSKASLNSQKSEEYESARSSMKGANTKSFYKSEADVNMISSPRKTNPATRKINYYDPRDDDYVSSDDDYYVYNDDHSSCGSLGLYE